MSFKTKIDIYPLENYIVAPNIPAAEEDEMLPMHQNRLLMGRKKSVLQGGSHTMHIASPHQGIRRMKTPREKLISLRKRCMDGQRVESVEGILMVHHHRQPHIILMKQRLSRLPLASGGGSGGEDGSRNVILSAALNNPEYTYRLPGGRCRPGEKPEDCLIRKLWKHLRNEEYMPGMHGRVGMGLMCPGGVSGASMHSGDTIVDVVSSSAGLGGGISPCFRVGDVLGKWYRPHLNPFMYPYVPPHFTHDAMKEVRTMFLVHMDRSVMLQIPFEDVELVAVPLFDLYDNTTKYSPNIVSIPVLLSRVFINCCSNVDF